MLRVLSVGWRGLILGLGGSGLVLYACAQSATVSVTPSADAFVRAATPTFNYGGAGAIAVSGANATNAVGVANGAFDSLIRFPASNIVASLDSEIGSHAWVITRARLHLTEMAAPPHPMFNRGVGAFEVRWIARDNWTEGTGVPAQPTTDGVRYQDLSSLLSPGIDVPLGHFTNSGLDASLTFDLVPTAVFANDVRAGGEVTLHLAAASPQIGFTIESRSFTFSNNWPLLEITGVAAPDGALRSITKTAPAQVTVTFDTASNWATVLQACGDAGFTSPSNLLAVQPQGISIRTNVQDSITGPVRFYRLLFMP